MCILGSLDVRNEPEVATKSGDATEAGGKETFVCKAKQFGGNGVLSIKVKAFGVTRSAASHHQGLIAGSHL